MPLLLALAALLSILLDARSAPPPSRQPSQEEAEEAPPPPTAEPGRWTFAIRPYLWAASVDGSVAVRSLPSQDFEADFSDIVSELDFAFMLSFEARPPSGDIGLLLDSVFLDVSGTERSFDWGLEQRLLELDVTWRVAKQVDLLAGARYVGFETSVSIPPSGASASRDESWVDPVIGARGALPLADRWALAGRGDIAGFGVGSEFSWQLAGYVLFKAAKWADVGLGYRHLQIDFEEGDADIDLGLSGPLLGVEFRL